MVHLTKAALLAMIREALDAHGLHDWNARVDHAKTRFGVCNYTKKTIGVSLSLARVNPLSETEDTILHEVAHALAGHSAGHGPLWKAKCREIGARPIRCSSANGVEPKWLVVCPNGHVRGGRHRRTKAVERRSCGECTPGRYDPAVALRFTPNPAAA